MQMKNSTYDVLKKVSLIVVPLVALISTLTEIWGFQYGTEIAATVSAFGVFLGACLTICSNTYYRESSGDGE